MNRKATIKWVKAREILDSRGNPTVEVEIITESGIRAAASCPSGASTGKQEAIELRDNDPKRYSGKGVMQAVVNVNSKISEALKGRSCEDQHEIDRMMVELDGTKTMGILGANATTAVSLACAKAAAMVTGVSFYHHIFELFAGTKSIVFPVPVMNIINGGKHAGSGLSIQEFMIIPLKADRPSEAIRMGSEIYRKLGSILSNRLDKSAVNVGDEGGYAPSLDYDELALKYIMDAISQSSYEPGEDVVVGIDAAASNFWNATKQRYVLNSRLMSPEDLLAFYAELADKYPLKYIEDPFMEDDLDSFVKITEELVIKSQ